MAKSSLDVFNTEAIKLAALGVTVLVASGDNGVVNFGCRCDPRKAVDAGNCACQADSSSSRSYWSGPAWTGTGYFPSFPATSPYVTAVGATMGIGSVLPGLGEGEAACQVCVPVCCCTVPLHMQLLKLLMDVMIVGSW